jgi:hypothetical protein
MASSNGATRSIPVTLSFTRQGPECASPALWEALANANLRIDLPESFFTTTSSGGVAVSTLQDNIIRLDSLGALYAPGITRVELTEQSATIGASVAPGVPTTIYFDLPGVQDLNNAIPDIIWDIQPFESIVTFGPRLIVGSKLQIDVYRGEIGATAPYPVISIKARGRIFVIPSPQPL